MKTLRTLVFASVATLVVTVSAFAADPSGTWKWSTTNQNGESFESTLKLELKDGKPVGMVTGRRGETAISDATLVNDNLKFSVVRERDGGKWEMKYDGKVTADSIKGTIDMPSRDGGEPRKVEWNAKKS